MSDMQSALGGARFDGAGASVAEIAGQGMITLRGAPEEIGAGVKRVTGLKMPGQRAMVTRGEAALAWMSPDEFLLLMPGADVPDREAELSQALSGVHALVADVSGARAVFRVDGAGAREALARLCPVDLDPSAFKPGEVRRTRLAQVPAAFWIDDDGAFSVVCFRSVAQYAFDILSGAAQGAPVAFFPQV